jgi:hypothetical protein
MTAIRTLIVTIFVAGLASMAFGQGAPAAPTAPAAATPTVTPAEAKNHVGDMATVCGKVVDTKVPKYGLSGRGKPVSFDLDQPEPNPVFFFVAFGAQPGGTEEVISAYKDKRVCVTGKINMPANTPFIMAADRSQIKTQAENGK